METSQYPRRTSQTFIVNRQMSQVIMARLCLPSRYAAKITYYRPVEQYMVVTAEEDCVKHGGTALWTDQIVVIAVHRRRQKSMGDHCSQGVCRSTTLGVLVS